MEDRQSSPLRAAGRRLARRVLVDAWYSPFNIMTSSRGLIHIARYMLDELQHGTTPVLYTGDGIAEEEQR